MQKKYRNFEIVVCKKENTKIIKFEIVYKLIARAKNIYCIILS